MFLVIDFQRILHSFQRPLTEGRFRDTILDRETSGSDFQLRLSRRVSRSKGKPPGKSMPVGCRTSHNTSFIHQIKKLVNFRTPESRYCEAISSYRCNNRRRLNDKLISINPRFFLHSIFLRLDLITWNIVSHDISYFYISIFLIKHSYRISEAFHSLKIVSFNYRHLRIVRKSCTSWSLRIPLKQ